MRFGASRIHTSVNISRAHLSFDAPLLPNPVRLPSIDFPAPSHSGRLIPASNNPPFLGPILFSVIIPTRLASS